MFILVGTIELYVSLDDYQFPETMTNPQVPIVNMNWTGEDAGIGKSYIHLG